MRRVTLLILAVAAIGILPMLALAASQPVSPSQMPSGTGRVFVPWVLNHASPSGDRFWDPRLTQRGAVLIPAEVTPGQGYWRLVRAVWYAENEPPFAGQHHILMDTLDEAGMRQVGVPIRVSSLDDQDTLAVLVTEPKPGELYSANFPMYVVAPAYRARPAGGVPADAVVGMGLGSLELPAWNIHTSYGLVWQWTVAPPPPPTATATPTATEPVPSATPTTTVSVTPTPTLTPPPTTTPRPTVTATPVEWPQLALTPLTGGLLQPVHITHAGDGSGRLFVVEQGGRIRIIQDGILQAAPFLDISSQVSCCAERGLLSVAFPPDYAAKRYFYVNYTDLAGNTVVARYRVTADANVADPTSGEIILTVGQPFANHNGGQIAFSPRDGNLYIGMGDGGSSGDPGNRAQNPADLLGKLLRIDVEAGVSPYAIPATNPFSQTVGFFPEIWAGGLRNPWRFAFDRLTGDLYIGDVGQNTYEEVDFQPAASLGGENYGWRVTEGFHCYNPTDCVPVNLTLPVVEYDHGLGCSITGGAVYRGTRFPHMAGIYFYADYCSGRIWGLERQDGVWRISRLSRAGFSISTFGEDEAGELYLADITGMIYRLTDATP